MDRNRVKARNKFVRLAVAILAFTGLLGILVGIPILLNRFGGNPIPKQLPQVKSFSEQLTNFEIIRLFERSVLVLSWIIWIYAIASITSSFVCEIRKLASAYKFRTKYSEFSMQPPENKGNTWGSTGEFEFQLPSNHKKKEVTNRFLKNLYQSGPFALLVGVLFAFLLPVRTASNVNIGDAFYSTGSKNYAISSEAPKGRESINLVASNSVDSNPKASFPRAVSHNGEETLVLTVGSGLFGAGLIEYLVRVRRDRSKFRREGSSLRLPSKKLSRIEARLRLKPIHDPNRLLNVLDYFESIHFPKGDIRTTFALLSSQTVSLWIENESGVQHESCVHSVMHPFVCSQGTNWHSISDYELRNIVDAEAKYVGNKCRFGYVSLNSSTTGLLMADLLQCGPLALEGLHYEVDAFLRNAIYELSSSPLCQGVDEVLVVGIYEDFSWLKKITQFETIAQLETYLRFTTVQTEGSSTAVIILGSNAVVENVNVIGGLLGMQLNILAAMQLKVGERIINVSDCGPIDREVSPYRFSEVELNEVICHEEVMEIGRINGNIGVRSHESSGIHELINLYEDSPSDHYLEASYVGVPIDSLVPQECNDQDHVSEDPEVIVRLLGKVAAEGTSMPIVRPKLLESLCYLALHPKGVAKVVWATALWPDQLLGRDSLNTAIWQLRRALGTSEDGIKHLPSAYSGELQLNTSVTTDLAMFTKMSKSKNPEDWRAALELIYGRPFEGLGEPIWLVVEGYIADTEAMIVDIVLNLGKYYLENGSAPDCLWAVRKGLLVMPYDERLWQLALKAAALQSNLPLVDSLMRELARVMECDEDLMAGISPETIQLYSAITGRSRPRQKLVAVLPDEI